MTWPRHGIASAGVDAPQRNVELKAFDPDPEGTLARALALGAREEGLLIQRDTYFHAGRGRLKLREEEPGSAHLIGYTRSDEDPDVRVSEYRIAPVSDPEAVRDVLEASLGVRVVVEKRRRLLLWRSVRIHLDEVSGLGTFLELEAVAPAGSDLAREWALVAHLREVLAITDDRLRDGSYSDALLRVSRAAPA